MSEDWKDDGEGRKRTPADGDDQAPGTLVAEKGAALPTALHKRRSTVADPEKAAQKLKYPKAVFFIIGNEFCERFTFYGMRTILSLFLSNSLELDEDTSTIIYHVFSCLCYLFPVLGAIIADSWLGKFKTIAYLSVVYAIGNIVVSVAAAKFSNIPSKELTYVGLLLIAIGTGGIKPCVSSFGGEQFTVPQQARQLASFFSVFYFSINAGSLISTYLTPELRTTQCLGSDTCYPLAFGIPAILMLVAIVIFLVGKPSYKITNPKGNIMVDVSMCIGNALKNKIRSKEKKASWLDYADDAKYSESLRNDIRAVGRVLLLFVPLPVFWALYDQQGSRWTFQANNMNGRMGSWVIKPDQMQIVNPILIMILLPLFDSVLYPALAKVNILKKPLQRLATGGLLGAVAFIISGVLQLQLEPNLPVETAAGFSQVRVFNGMPCNMTLMGHIGGEQIFGPVDVPSMDFWANTSFTTSGDPLDLTASGSCGDGALSNVLQDETSLSFHMYLSDAATKSVKFAGPYTDSLNKDAFPKTRLMYHFTGSTKHKVEYKLDGKVQHTVDGISGVDAEQKMPDLSPGQYSIYVDDTEVASEFLDVGGFYNILVDDSSSKVQGSILTVITPNTVNLFWLMPQYVVISVAEIMVSVTGLEFSFTQAPNSMKSVLSSAWLLTDSIGNIIIILITTVKFFPLQSSEFFLFAGLMVAVMLIFIWLAVLYVPVEAPATDEEEEDADSTSTPSTATPQDTHEKEKY